MIKDADAACAEGEARALKILEAAGITMRRKKRAKLVKKEAA
jgi:hypothetical protein